MSTLRIRSASQRGRCLAKARISRNKRGSSTARRTETDVPISRFRTEPKYEVSDEQSQLIVYLFPPKNPSDKSGRPGACVEGYSLDFTDRRTAKRITETFFFPRYMLASSQKLDRDRHLGKSVGSACASARSPVKSQPQRVDCRRLVFLCKNGERVGNTERGKGPRSWSSQTVATLLS